MSERATGDENVWLSPLPAPESRAREAMKFVRVSLVGESGHSGQLTDISISIILVELKRRGLTLSNGERA